MAAPTDEPTIKPVPPRFRWLKRIGLAVLVYVVFLIALRLWFGYEADRRLAAKIAEIHARGEPILITDFAVAPVPDTDNAAILLTQAAAAMVETLQKEPEPNDPTAANAPRIAISLLFDSDLAREHLPEVGQLIEANRKALQLVHEGCAKEQTDWGVRFSSPVINTVFPHLSALRALAKLLCVSAIYFHTAGDDSAAIEKIHDCLTLARIAGAPPSVLINHLVVVAVDALSIRAIEATAPTLMLATSTPKSLTIVTPAERDRVMSLIARLLDDGPFRESMRQACLGERLLLFDDMRNFLMLRGAGPSPFERLRQMILGPFSQLDAADAIEFESRFLEGACSPAWAEARAGIPREPTPTISLRQWPTLGGILWPSLERVLVQHFRELAKRRMAATALAIRLYELDHGQRPAALTDLVPEYLPAVPVDLFAADGRPLGYRLDRPHPLLYSVGDDGLDQGGAYEPNEAGGVNMNVADIPFFLDGWRPPVKSPGVLIPPATQPIQSPTSDQAAKHLENEENAERQHAEDQHDRGQP